MSADFTPTRFFVDKEHPNSLPFEVTRQKQICLKEIANRFPGSGWLAQVRRAGFALGSFPLTFHELKHHLRCPDPELTLRKIGQQFPLLKIQSFKVKDLTGEDHEVDAVFLREGLPIAWEAYGREVTPEEVREAQKKVTDAQIAALLACHAARTKGEGKA